MHENILSRYATHNLSTTGTGVFIFFHICTGSVKRTWRTPFGFHLSDVAVSSSRDIQLTDLGIEVELSGSSYIFEGVPRRVREHLAPEKGKTICGWGLWIEEDFIIKWYFLFLINVPAIVLLCVGIYESTRHGLTLLAVSSYGLSLTSYVFAQWVTLKKDSKR